jgi:hypothetical protein
MDWWWKVFQALKLLNRISWNLVGSKDTICSCAFYQEILIPWFLWELCPFELRNFLKFTTEAACHWWWKVFQGNSDIMIDSCTYIYIYIQVSVRDSTLECLQITPTTFRGSTFPGNMHNYIWCPYYLPMHLWRYNFPSN